MAERCLQLLVKKEGGLDLRFESLPRPAPSTWLIDAEETRSVSVIAFEMREVDVVIAATSSAETILSCDDLENLMKARRNRPPLLIDLSVPRNIDPAVGQLENVSLYDMDDLGALARRGVQGRGES